MTDERLIETHIARNAPAPRILRMTAKESALLLNLLSENARAWNAPLRLQLHQVVTGTEAFNALTDMRNGTV